MKQDDVKIGGECRVKIGSRLATVTVLRRLDGRGRARFECRTADTGRIIKATAARLRSMPPAPATLVPPTAVPGMFSTVNAARLVEPLVGRNRQLVERIVGTVHVNESWRDACRIVYRVIGKGGKLRNYPRHLRRGAWQAVAEVHAANRELYRHVMGTGAGPSMEQITAALLGDTDARRSVLA